MAKRLVPKGDRIVVLQLERELESMGISLPETEQEKQVLGIVVFVGPDCKSTEVSEVVMFGQYAGLEIEIGDKRFVVMRECEVLGSLEEYDEPA